MISVSEIPALFNAIACFSAGELLIIFTALACPLVMSINSFPPPLLGNNVFRAEDPDGTKISNSDSKQLENGTLFFGGINLYFNTPKSDFKLASATVYY